VDQLAELVRDKDCPEIEFGINKLEVLCKNNKSLKLKKCMELLLEKHHSLLRTGGANMKKSFDDLDPRPNGTNALKEVFRCYVHDDMLEIVKLLLKHSQIDLSYRVMDFFEELFLNDRWGKTSKPLAEIIELLIGEGLDITARDGYGWTALHILVGKYNGVHGIQLAKLLIDKGIDVNATDRNGKNVLHYLADWNKFVNRAEMVKVLIEKGIDVYRRDKDDCHALHRLKLYKGSDKEEIIQLIQERSNLN